MTNRKLRGSEAVGNPAAGQLPAVGPREGSGVRNGVQGKADSECGESTHEGGWELSPQRPHLALPPEEAFA